ncbi:FecR family protein [Chitinophaga defluvii]|uniref:FecR domain-containing protein n=1 Tax=Chitinophaga defluvii TaxID=3163343 RepID=A0ABV2T2H7_9BACT
MNYREYDAEDLLLETSFLNYCLGSKDTDVLFWENWLLENPDKANVVKQAQELFLLLNGNHTAAQFREHQSRFRETFSQHLEEGPAGAGHLFYTREQEGEHTNTEQGKYRSRSRKIGRYVVGIAASLLLLVAIRQLVVHRYAADKAALEQDKYTYVSMPGERKSFQLPDGSTVLLNGGSVLRITPAFNEENRQVHLEGEAYFDVAQDAGKPFVIQAGDMCVKVLGTTFNVKAYPQDKTLETVLIRGAVEVTVKDMPRQQVILKPQQKIIIEKPAKQAAGIQDSVSHTHHQREAIGKIAVKNVQLLADDSTVMETSWTLNRLVFDNETLAVVATKIERWYGVKVQIDPAIADTYTFTGIFENESIQQMLKALQLSLPFHYKLEDKTLFITK